MHRAGQAKPVISNKTTLIGLGIGVFILLIAPTIGAALVNRVKQNSGGLIFQELTIPPNFSAFHFPEGEHLIKIQLDKRCWSGKIFIPPGHDFSIDANCAEVRFHDGRIVNIGPDTAQDVGTTIRNSVFQLRGENATIYVERRIKTP